jgi:hypothetical protein
MKKKPYSQKMAFLFACLLVLVFSGCKKDIGSSPSETSTVPRGVTPYSFNWETVNWMPTPPGQSQIPPPWIGQGSLASVYGTDVINDHKAADGWKLVYNTFDPGAPGSLVNPYFILYNQFRGLMRIYLYTTTQFVYPSTYVVDGLKIVSSKSSSMLNFLGTDIVDPAQNQTTFSQIEPAPSDGSQPLASNKWYMLQYEMAYDPQIAGLGYQDIQLSWFSNFNSVSTISLGGNITGTIKTAVGAPSTDLTTALQKGGQVLGTSAVSLIGKSVLDNNGNASTGDNTLGMPNSTFKAIASGVTAAFSAATGNIPGALVGIFSAIFGGSSSSPTLNLSLNASITLDGTTTTSGSFPSSPTSMYVPGTQIPSAAQNFVPLYNQPLGVFNLTARPTVTETISRTPDANGYYDDYWDIDLNALQNLVVFNPAVVNYTQSGATVYNFNGLIQIVDPFLADDFQNQNVAPGNRMTLQNAQYIGNHIVVQQILKPSVNNDGDPAPLTTEYGKFPPSYRYAAVAVQVSFVISPNDGVSPKSTIVKTFYANVNTTFIN